MDNIKFSIIIPVYNVETFLKKCLNSILSQSLKEFEVICVNDESTDNSLNILQGYAKTDSRVKIINQKNAGAGLARNKGLKIARGEFILFIDSDDWLEPDTLRKLYINAVSNKSDMVLFNSVEQTETGIGKKRIYFPVDESIDYNHFTFDYNYQPRIVMNFFFVIWSKMYRTSFLREHNIEFMNHPMFNDVEFHIKTVLLAKRMSYLPEILYNYNKLNVNSIQTTNFGNSKSFILINLIDDVEEYLRDNNYYDEFEFNFIRFKIHESKNRMFTLGYEKRTKFYQMLRESYLRTKVSSDVLKQLPHDVSRFYIHVLNCPTYFDYELLNPDVPPAAVEMGTDETLDKKTRDILNSTDKITINGISNTASSSSKEMIDIINGISRDMANNTFLTKEDMDLIKDMELFDENYYLSQFNSELTVDPFLHYLYVGYKDNKNPSEVFDGNFYNYFNENSRNSNINPLVYFVKTGIREGIVRINKGLHQPKSINKIEYDEKFKTFDEIGINTTEYRDKRVIVSLTTFPERINDVKYDIYCLLNQTYKPDMVILWLAEEQFPNKEYDLDRTLLKFRDNGLTIKWCEDIKSFKKIVPAIREYPNDIIVTADDDLYYEETWLENMIKEHEKYPDYIIGTRVRKVKVLHNVVQNYTQWEFINEHVSPSLLNFPTNGSGTLFPPHCLHEDLVKPELFNTICPTTDDIWIWAMAVLNKTKIKTVQEHSSLLTYVNPARDLQLTKQKTLWSINKEGENDKQFKALLNHYPELTEILLNEKHNGA